MAKRIIYPIITAIILVITAGCGPKADLQNSILIGTIAGPETELVEVAKSVAKQQYDLDVHIIPFNDYVEPNRALEEGEINVNLFQHQPYLDQVITSQGLKLMSIGQLFIYPMGIYSDKYKKLSEIPDGAVVAIPNDESNQTRSFLLLAKTGLIKLKDPNASSISKFDIQENKKKLKFEEVDPAFMVRMLPDLDLAVINTNYAVMGGLFPNRDALAAENKDSKYANIVVIRTQDKDQEKFSLLMKALRSPEVIDKAKQLFKDQAVIAW